MKRILCSVLVVSLPFDSILADAPKSKNANVTLVYQHELPNVPGKSIKGVLVEYGPGGCSPGPRMPNPRLSTRPGGDPAAGQRRTGDDLRGRTELLRAARRHGVSANASEKKPAKLLAVRATSKPSASITQAASASVLIGSNRCSRK